MKLDNIKRIIKEDFPKEDRNTIEKLGYVVNSFMEQVINIVNGNIGFDNLNQEIVKYTTKVNSLGTPLETNKIKVNIKNVQGIICIRAVNKTNSTSYPVNTPFISYGISGNIITINNIKGLEASDKYELTLLLIG